MKKIEIPFTPSLSSYQFIEAIEKLTDKTHDDIQDELEMQNIYPLYELIIFSHDNSPGWLYQAINEVIKLSNNKRILVYEN